MLEFWRTNGVCAAKARRVLRIGLLGHPAHEAFGFLDVFFGQCAAVQGKKHIVDTHIRLNILRWQNGQLCSVKFG